MASKNRHAQLIAAGWRYDATQDRYAAPGSPTDGTERWYNQAAAWQTLESGKQKAESEKGPDPRVARTADERRQEPQ